MTDEEIGLRRINAGVVKYNNYSRLQEGMIKFNPYFVEHVQEASLMFKEMFQEDIIRLIGDSGWAIWFIQLSQETVTYLVDIYVDDVNHFSPIAKFIQANIHKDFNLEISYRGSLSAYIGNQ